jgi:hypothetical protein
MKTAHGPLTASTPKTWYGFTWKWRIGHLVAIAIKQGGKNEEKRLDSRMPYFQTNEHHGHPWKAQLPVPNNEFDQSYSKQQQELLH